MADRGVILIAGPTASGKSALALRVADAVGGTVINADSMQVYRELRVLTARPAAADEARAPHRLYGIMPVSSPCSAGRWRALALREIEAAITEGRTPILVGGTGLYFHALTQGLAPVPEVPPGFRDDAQATLQRLGAAAFHAALAERDPVMAARLPPGDTQRLVRAWEVLAATGNSLATWQDKTVPGEAFGHPWYGVVLQPPRATLYQRCDERLRGMVEQGAVQEVAALLDAGVDLSLPAMKALGVPAFVRHLRGELALEDAVEMAQRATRQYAKRQTTWFKNKMQSWNHVLTQDSECFFSEIFPKISQFLLTTTG